MEDEEKEEAPRAILSKIFQIIPEENANQDADTGREVERYWGEAHTTSQI